MEKEMLNDASLDVPAGGEGETNPPTPWICPFCGTVVMVRDIRDAQKHLNSCPENPYA